MIDELFRDQNTIRKVQTKLPELFHIAELESSRAGRIGMEVGSVREKILIALLIYKFDSEVVQKELPILKPKVVVIAHRKPISIKTTTGMQVSGVKLIWTIDRDQAIRLGNE